MKISALKYSIAAAVLAGAISCPLGDLRAADSPSSPDTTSAAPSENVQEGIAVMNGTVYSVHAGKPTAITQDIVLRISPNGTITCFDGRTYSLPPGQLLTIEAKFAPVTVKNVPVSPLANPANPANSAAPESSAGDGAAIVTPPVPVTIGNGSGAFLSPGVVPSPEPGFPQVHHRTEVENNNSGAPQVRERNQAVESSNIPSGNVPAPRIPLQNPSNQPAATTTPNAGPANQPAAAPSGNSAGARSVGK